MNSHASYKAEPRMVLIFKEARSIMTTIENNITEAQQNELAAARQSLAEKDKQIQELKIRIGVLEDLLSHLSAQRAPQTQTQRILKPAPRRWNVR
jgi:predicted translin family RNA/ssDNA-binding protein